MRIFSLRWGSYTSKVLGTFNVGIERVFRFPLPETVRSNVRAWSTSTTFLFAFTVKEKSPTAPVKLSGRPFSGKGFTLIILSPAEIVLLTLVVSALPKILRLFPGTSTGTFKVKGSISRGPVF